MNALAIVGDPKQNTSLSRPVRLKSLFPLASYIGCADVKVASVSHDSECVQPEGAFVVIPGREKIDMNSIGRVLSRGAAVLIVENPVEACAIPQVVVPNAREAYAWLCSALMGHPSRSMALAAITGTNGKTSVSWILRSIVQTAFGSCGLLGTIEYDDGLNISPATLTTPSANTLQPLLKQTRLHGCRHTVLEASSHGLDQHRLSGCELDTAVITNITQDHYDYHKTRDAYQKAKASISRHLSKKGILIVNADDPGALDAAASAKHADILTYSLNSPSDIKGSIQMESLRGSRFLVRNREGLHSFSTPLIGRHQISNCLAAIAIAMRWGISAETIQRGLSRLRSIPGRLQLIEEKRGVSFFVDYAHTPDALTQSLTHLRRLTSGRIILVFGAGGDRDREKRPLMGRAAMQADLAIITNDNPRTENPLEIIQEIGAGVNRDEITIEPDRRKAIDRAVRLASAGDVVLIAGKGHEKTQTIGTEQIPFDDSQVVRDCLESSPESSSLTA